MSLFVSEEQRQFRLRARAFIDENILTFFENWENSQTMPRRIFEQWGESGFAGVLAPRRWGGSELDFSYSVILVEELMRSLVASVGISLLLPANTICPLLVRYASDELRRRFLQPLVRGKLIASLAVTEPDGGSDIVGALRCSAVSDGDYWIVTGEKVFITNAPIADVVFVLARTSEIGRPLSMSLIAVPTHIPGFSCSQQHLKLGLHASPTGAILLEGCRVPKNYLIGQMNYGYIYFSDVIAEERLLIAVGAVAYARGCLERTVQDMKSRQVEGASAVEYLALRDEIGFMVAELEALKAFVYGAAELVSLGESAGVRANIAKYAVCEKVQRIVHRCVELHDRYRLCEGSWMARAICDTRVLSIFAGTSETMRDLASAQVVRQRRLAALGGRMSL
jgi:alkylation response protein AidB-like acyl-CoA dehydrogenase